MEQSQKPKTDTNKILAAVAVTFIVAGGGGFLGGVQYQKSQGTNSTSTTNNMNGFPGMDQSQQGTGFGPQSGGGFAGRGGTSGSIASISGDSMVVTLSDGTTSTVKFDSSTTVVQQSTGSTTDLAVGKSVQVMSTPGSSSTTATRIIITS